MNKKQFNAALETVTSELNGSRFEEDALAVLTHFLNSGHTVPDVPEKVYSEIAMLISTRGQAKEKFLFVDLFAGIGGFRLALSKHGGHSVFSSEWEKNAQNICFIN